MWKAARKVKYTHINRNRIPAKDWKVFYAKSMLDRRNDLYEYTDCRHPDLDKEITTNEVAKALKKLKKSRADSGLFLKKVK